MDVSRVKVAPPNPRHWDSGILYLGVEPKIGGVSLPKSSILIGFSMK